MIKSYHTSKLLSSKVIIIKKLVIKSYHITFMKKSMIKSMKKKCFFYS